MPLAVTSTLVLDDGLLTERFVRASGPGGQNVNKVSTAVELRLDLLGAPFDAATAARLRALAGSRVVDDHLVVEAREHRTQVQNRDAARAKLVALIRRALVPPKRRRATRPSVASKERRLETKQRRARVKAQRGKIDRD